MKIPHVLLAAGLACALAVVAAHGQTSFATRNARPGGNFLWSIAAGPTGLVAVGDGGTILTSPTGAVWTRRNSGVTDWLVGVTFAQGKFVVVGDRGRVLTSVDGVQWSGVTASGTTQRLNNVIFGGNKFVAVGEAGTILTSPDGVTWTPRVSGVTGWLRGAFYSSFTWQSSRAPDRYTTQTDYFACGAGGRSLRSSDGITWSSTTPFGTNDLEALTGVSSSVVFDPLIAFPYPAAGLNSFATIGQNGTVGHWGYVQGYQSKLLNTSYLTQVANTYSTGIDARLRGIVQAANALFATGEGGAILSAPSAAGPWTRLNSGTTANLVGGLYVGNTLFVVGENETILQSTPLYYSRLVNISTRGQVGVGGNIMISGFVVTGPGRKSVLVRAAGPALGALNVPGTLAAPVLTVFDGAGRPMATNTGWSTAANAGDLAATAARVGAFAFGAGSADSALLLGLDPGSYTVQVAGRNNATGVALAEVYDADTIANEGARAVNVSTRGLVGTGSDVLIAGFSINGAASRRVLIRAVGPTLADFGVSGTLAEPVISVFRGSTLRTTTRGSWSAQTNADELRGASVLSGAFDLAEDSQDALLVLTLEPGPWTVQVSGANNTTGLALVEVYDLP